VRPEILLAWAAAGVGVIAVVSALTPEMASRSDFVRGVLPPGVPTAARILALAFGLALVWLARSLARRRRRAWQLAVILVSGAAAAHLAKGLDVEEAVISLALLAALFRYRRRFDVPGDPSSVRPLIGTLSLLAAGLGGALLFDQRGWPFPERLDELVAAAGFVLGFRALYLWLRPFSQRVRQGVEERRTARAIVEAEGRDSLSFFALRRDKSWFFSPSGRAFLAYRVVGGCALVSGDLIGEEEEFDELLSEFRRVVHAHGWRLAFLGAADLERYERLGLKAIKIGDEAVLRPCEFSLEGRAIRKVRQSVSRLEKAGYRFRMVASAEADAALRAELELVSAQWRGNQPERGFTMAMDELYADPDIRFAIAEDADGRVGGFLHLVPAPAGRGWSLSTMRRRPGTPNGLMEFLIAETAAWARAQDAAELSLNFCAFRDLLLDEGGVVRRALRVGLLKADRVFQLERLHSFNKKFFPEWRPRYLCIERYADLPAVGLAYLRVEQLLTPPRPWARRPAARV